METSRTTWSPLSVTGALVGTDVSLFPPCTQEAHFHTFSNQTLIAFAL